VGNFGKWQKGKEKMKKILLVCSAGMSTSLLVEKMRRAAAQQAIQVKIDAIAEVELQEHLGQADVILLGPQVKFLLSKIREMASPQGIPVEVVDSRDYGSMNGEKVLGRALEIMK
jgi:PTS system cellobiose-specific IIB component